MHEKIHIGDLIRQRLEENGQSVSWLAKKVHSDRSNFYKILKRSHIDTELLLNISKVLNFNFFAYYSDLINETKTEEK